jgi:uncharacterized membrane protein YedE/YeeE
VRIPLWVGLLPMVIGGWLGTSAYDPLRRAMFLGFARRQFVSEALKWIGYAAMVAVVVVPPSIIGADGEMWWIVSGVFLLIAVAGSAVAMRVLSAPVDRWLDGLDTPTLPPPPTA